MNKHTVIIPTAGLGSRLGALSKDLNKSLLPYKNKPVLAHIIDQFPADTKFIIPVGYRAEQVKDFCKLAYSNRNIEFVSIDDYTSTSSGPGYTISKCLEKIKEPFWYIPCDTYFEEEVVSAIPSEDVVFVKRVPTEISSLYTMFKVENNRVTDLTFKETQNEDWLAFTGVMHIHDWEGFGRRLMDQESPEIIWTIRKGTSVKELPTWQDFGNLKIYKESFAASQKYDFTKTDEFTYICNNKVIKWWADPTIARKKYEKILANPDVYPSNCQYQGDWLAYNYFDGTTVYESFKIDILNNLLLWLDEEVWIHKSRDISEASKEFYKEKTLGRINKFLEKYPDIEDAKSVNGVKVKRWRHYLDHMDWELLEKTNLPGYMHGDLQFDNMIINADNKFKVIDWRHEFANLVEIGDIYYDLAKLSGGFIINYSKIKQNEFRFENINGDVKLTVPSIDNYEECLNIVKNFVEAKGWNYRKVQLLIPIIFWNMAPLHTPPFDKFLWYLGIKLFEELGL